MATRTGNFCHIFDGLRTVMKKRHAAYTIIAWGKLGDGHGRIKQQYHSTQLLYFGRKRPVHGKN